MRTYGTNKTYVYEDDQILVILTAAAFAICATANRLKYYSPGQLLFFCDIILPIKHTVDWEFIRQRNQTQINKDNIHENKNRFDFGYKVGDKVMINNHAEYKYETPYKGPFWLTLCFANSMVNIQYGLTKIRYNTLHVNPYKYDTNVEDIKPKNMGDDVNICLPVIYFCRILRLGNKVYNQMSKNTLKLSHIGRGSEFFMMNSFSSHGMRLF